MEFGIEEEVFLADSLLIREKLLAYVDEKTVEMAIALNLTSELAEIVTKGIEPGQEQALKSKVMGSVLKMNLELHSLMSAIDCEEEKSEQVASFVERELRKKERNLTVAAIVTGALVGVGTGIMLAANNSGNDLPEYLGIAGGLTEVFLGLSILRLDRKVMIQHTKNILRDVYLSDSRPSYFPPAVWYYFNSQNRNEAGISLKEQLVDRWNTFNSTDESLSLLISNGGAYSPDMLKSRSEMLDQLESQIALISKDLLYFLSRVEALIYPLKS
ncbi:hypothetical protein ADIS_2740 [Lunatimonas lonarensis]|uniref:Uncharacterized protein n=1 Tax=Lunatimonas lonarensis TaxID=1232681 RepID=R7ZS89_9BACT|nr:hypothetical protein ADIS_2740 [Lunatimonas lonarensis]